MQYDNSLWMKPSSKCGNSHLRLGKVSVSNKGPLSVVAVATEALVVLIVEATVVLVRVLGALPIV